MFSSFPLSSATVLIQLSLNCLSQRIWNLPFSLVILLFIHSVICKEINFSDAWSGDCWWFVPPCLFSPGVRVGVVLEKSGHLVCYKIHHLGFSFFRFFFPSGCVRVCLCMSVCVCPCMYVCVIQKDSRTLLPLPLSSQNPLYYWDNSFISIDILYWSIDISLSISILHSQHMQSEEMEICIYTVMLVIIDKNL